MGWGWCGGYPGKLTSSVLVFRTFELCHGSLLLFLVFQLLSLLLAMVLRAMVSPRQSELDDEDDYENPINRARENLLAPQANQTSSSGSSNIDNWRSRIREKVNKNLIA